MMPSFTEIGRRHGEALAAAGHAMLAFTRYAMVVQAEALRRDHDLTFQRLRDTMMATGSGWSV